MDNLQKALALLNEKYGEIDNIKFRLGDAKGMSPGSVQADILRLAEGICSGEFAPQKSFPEDKLEHAKIAI